MPAPVRYPSGISTGLKGSALFNLPGQDPTKFYSYFNDFSQYTAAEWTVTAVGASTVTQPDAAFGEILLTTAAADNDGVQLQKLGEAFLPVIGKKMWFKTRFRISDATQSDFLLGLAVLDTTAIVAAGDGVPDGVFFQKDDASTSVSIYSQLDTTTGQTTAAGVHTMVAATNVDLGFEYDGLVSIKYFVNDVHKGTLAVSSLLLPNTEITPTIAFLTGEAVAKTMNVDYIFAAIER
jgi:hypothetical protein